MTESTPGLSSALRRWFREQSQEYGLFRAYGRLAGIIFEFLRDSLPSRRRQRYGDVDYDWEQRVDTTSATIGWRDRLLGLFHSPYQPTERALFHEMLAELHVDFHEFVFVDIGSGKGRVLLMAADHPFRRVVGVELLPALHRVAEENIRRYKNSSQQCFQVEAFCGDARNFEFPLDPLVIYLFNPLPEAGLAEVMENLEHSLQQHPRAVFLIYHNPLLEPVLLQCIFLQKIRGTQQYSIFNAP